MTFKLSDKVFGNKGGYEGDLRHIKLKDIKEFIRLLKEKMKSNELIDSEEDRVILADVVYEMIDKLSGFSDNEVKGGVK